MGSNPTGCTINKMPSIKNLYEAYTGKYGKFLGVYRLAGKNVRVLEADVDAVAKVADRLNREHPDWTWSDFDLEMACMDELADSGDEHDTMRIRAAVKSWWDWDVARTGDSSQN